MGAFFFGSHRPTRSGCASQYLFVYGLVVVAGELSLARVLDRFQRCRWVQWRWRSSVGG